MDSTFTTLFASAEQGDGDATDALFTALYSELHRLARRQLSRSGTTLGVTTLLHEAYLNMSRREAAVFPDSGRFMAYAAKVMRGLIIDYARNRQARKRGGGFEITSLDGEVAGPEADGTELSLIGAALDELAGEDPSLAQLVDLKFFCGFSFTEIASMRGVTERTVQRHWEKARLYLHRRVRGASLA
jgi:RNA polymerase sigma factor (TIGR02999 family)